MRLGALTAIVLLYRWWKYIFGLHLLRASINLCSYWNKWSASPIEQQDQPLTAPRLVLSSVWFKDANRRIYSTCSFPDQRWTHVQRIRGLIKSKAWIHVLLNLWAAAGWKHRHLIPSSFEFNPNSPTMQSRFFLQPVLSVNVCQLVPWESVCVCKKTHTHIT